MKKLNLLILVSLLCVGLVQAKEATTQYERALINAAKEGNASQVRGLLEAGTDPNVTDKDGNTPLYYAVEKDLAMVDMLLYAGADMNYGQEKYAETPLFRSMVVLPNDDSIRLRLLKEKFDPNAVTCKSGDAECYTLLSWTVKEENSIKIVGTVLKKGADVNKPVYKFTPLHFALVKKGNDEKITELLLKAGADPWKGYFVYEKYKDPLILAKQSGNEQKVQLIKDAQAATKEQHKKDEKLIKAVQKGNVEQVRKLLAEGANPNACGDKNVETGKPWAGQTALVYANNLEIAQMLLNAGADVDAADWSNGTPLMWASKPKQLEKVKWLIKHGANVNNNLAKHTPLTLAVNVGYYWEYIEALLNAGADVNLRDRTGHGPLYYAKLRNNKKAEEALLQRRATLTKEESKDLVIAIAEKETKEQQAQAQAAAKKQQDAAFAQELLGIVETGLTK